MYKIHFLKVTPSTNRVAYALALKGEPEGTAVIADSQSEGRGRLGRVWESPPGKGLYCSIIVRPRIRVEDYARITLTAGLAVAIALEEVTGLQIDLKWPNDVYVKGRKCCGILTESSAFAEDENERFAVVGIGINVNSDVSDFPLELREKVTSLCIFRHATYDIQKIFQLVRSKLLDKLRLFENKGFEPILNDWRKRDFLYGKWLEWISNSGDIIYGKSVGPDASGRLMVKDKYGKIHHIISGEIGLANIKAVEGL